MKNITVKVVIKTKIVLKRFKNPGPRKFLTASRSFVISAMILPVLILVKNEGSSF